MYHHVLFMKCWGSCILGKQYQLSYSIALLDLKHTQVAVLGYRVKLRLSGVCEALSRLFYYFVCGQGLTHAIVEGRQLVEWALSTR